MGESPGIRNRCSGRTNQRPLSQCQPGLDVHCRRSGSTIADDAIESLLEHAGQTRALLFVGQLRRQRIDVDRQPPLPPQVVPDVLVGRQHVCGSMPSRFASVVMKRLRVILAMSVVHAVVRQQTVLVPDRHSVAAPPATERPARQRFPRIPLALTAVQHAARSELLLESSHQRSGTLALLAGQARSVFHSAPSMSSIDTNVGSPPIVSLTSAADKSRSTRWPSASICAHCSSVYGRVTRGDS